jgi:hypothetical protein
MAKILSLKSVEFDTRGTIMSRYKVGDYEYGYDRPLQEYFLIQNIPEIDDFENDCIELVGSLGDIYGSAMNLLQEIDRLKIPIPAEHREKLILDLPI